MILFKKILHYRAVHFILIGFALFGMERVASRFLEKSERTIVQISSDQIQSLRRDFVKQIGHEPSKEQLNALIHEAIDDEILVREARRLLLDKGDESVRLRLITKMRALGEGARYSSEDELLKKAYELKLDDDTVIRRHLIQKMQILLAQSTKLDIPSDDEVRKYAEQNLKNFEVAPQLTFSHVFISSPSKRNAKDVLLRLQNSSLSEKDAETLTDPFPLGFQISAASEALLQRRFGKDFAAKVFAAPVGQWVGPIESPYGSHLIHVDKGNTKVLPSIEVLRAQVARNMAREKVAIQVEENMERLRKLYPTSIDWNFVKKADNASL